MTILGSRETVPTLRQVLAEMAGRAPLLIEIKASFPDDHAALAQAVAAELDGYAGPYAVQSFHPGVVDWFRQNRPAMPRGQIASAAEDYRDLAPPVRDALMRLLDEGFGAPHFIAFDIRYLPSPLTQRARGVGLPVLTWTVRTAEHKARARAHADNVIFEGCEP
jgi:glycerophosphoryl diester phosphodiesterase